MKNDKIIQFMTTNRRINVLFEGVYTRQTSSYPVLGLALMEDEEGTRDIIPMYIGPKGYIEYLDKDQEGFLGLSPESDDLYTNEVYQAV